MKRAVIGIPLVAGIAVAWASAAMAGPPPEITCAPGPGTYNVTTSGSPQTDSVLFSNFTADDVTTAAGCTVNAAITPLPAGTVAAYSAEYRAYLEVDSRGKIVVTNEGRTSGVELATDDTGPFDGFALSDFAGSNAAGTGIDATIDLSLLEYVPGSTLTLESVEFVELARTTTTDIQASVDQLAADRTSVITHLNTTADLISGAGQKFDAPDGFGAIGGVGSATFGITGRRTLGDGLSLNGGAALIDQSAGGATTAGLLFAGSLRYLAPGTDLMRPFVEAGLRSAPALALTFTHQTVTNNGTQTATGTANGATFGGYLKGGVLVAPDPTNEIVFSASLAKDWLHTGDYTETVSGSNLFAATAPAQTASFDTAKLGVEWTTQVAPAVDLTLSGAVGHGFAENAFATNVAFAGSFSGAARSENFIEYGARATYAYSPSTTLGVFVFGATGESSGTHAQIGGDFNVSF